MSVAFHEESAQIRLKMASLRRHMHKDARGIVANTTQLLDWKDYVEQFPRSLIAAGLLTGFVFVPGRKVQRSVKLSQESIDDLLSQRHPSSAAAPKRSPVTSVAVRMLTGVALNGVSVLLRRSLKSYFTSPTKSNGTSTVRPFRTWSHEACLLTLGSAFTIGGACVLWFAVIRVGQAATSMKGSQEELAQNLMREHHTVCSPRTANG